MRSIANLFSAFSNLAASINGLAAVVDAVSGRLRQAVALDEAAPALPHGEVLDNAEVGNGTSTKRSKMKS